ncbi:hypothetical protein [Klebsiella pneumoniae]|uniref:hypothetical protein n=1 Tax=Klebsiella pneumoniae TaxID=573 RepID=UPI0035A22BE3|nr:hypothetical protein [Klebsiella pneumoniae]
MKERGMIFNADMVRAILDGRKTQTRRIMKPQPEPCPRGGHWWPSNVFKTMLHVEDEMQNGKGGWGGLVGDACPFGDVGDRIWVRETWQAIHEELNDDGYVDETTFAPSIPKVEDNYWHSAYAADNWCEEREQRGFPWRPSIHMPRWASRILLEITNIGVQRIHSISQNDAAREGLMKLPATGRYCINHGDQYFGGASHDAREVFSWLWQSIYGEESWEANPWVWVIEFKRIEDRAA